MKTDMNKIADKIQKLLSLAGNNPSEEEAKAALLKAQKLMAEYNLTEGDLGEGYEMKYSLELCKIKVNPRSKLMCMIIAESFACKVILHGGDKIAFFGREDNAQAAKSAMEFIHKVLERGMSAVCREYGLSTSQRGASEIYNAYASGFIRGLKDCLDAQTTALAIVVPQDVKDKFAEKFPNLKASRSRGMVYGSSYSAEMHKGYQDGKSVMGKRSITE